MGVVIALGAPIGGQLFKGLEPGINGRMLVAQSIPLVVSQ